MYITRKILVKVELPRVERLADGALVQQEQAVVAADLVLQRKQRHLVLFALLRNTAFICLAKILLAMTVVRAVHTVLLLFGLFSEGLFVVNCAMDKFLANVLSLDILLFCTILLVNVFTISGDVLSRSVLAENVFSGDTVEELSLLGVFVDGENAIHFLVDVSALLPGLGRLRVENLEFGYLVEVTECLRLVISELFDVGHFLVRFKISVVVVEFILAEFETVFVIG